MEKEDFVILVITVAATLLILVLSGAVLWHPATEVKLFLVFIIAWQAPRLYKLWRDFLA